MLQIAGTVADRKPSTRTATVMKRVPAVGYQVGLGVVAAVAVPTERDLSVAAVEIIDGNSLIPIAKNLVEALTNQVRNELSTFL